VALDSLMVLKCLLNWRKLDA